MRIVFFGTPEFAVPSLCALLREGHQIVGVVTQPDRPHGRSRSRLVPPPVKREAIANDIPVLQPERPAGDLFTTALRKLDAELGVVVAYGHILRPAILETPSRGMINVHASLLPRFRGAAPIQYAILAGDCVTGITIMQMEAGLDTGPVLHRAEMPIREDDTAGTLGERLAALGAETLADAVSLLAADAVRPVPQDDATASYAPKIDRAVARIAWEESADRVARRIRSVDPAPGAWTRAHEQEVKLFGARPAPGTGEPGTVLAAGDTLLVAAGDGAVEIREVQPAGRKRVPARAWVNGRGVAVGARLG
jgi:methionyl-tRNA formyltransferase